MLACAYSPTCEVASRVISQHSKTLVKISTYTPTTSNVGKIKDKCPFTHYC